MAKEKTADTPSDAEILSYSNVPIPVAARYLGCSPEMVRESLRQGTTPFGYATQNLETHTWSFQISPGLLVNFQNGTLPQGEKAVIEQIVAEVEKVLELRSKAALEVLAPGLLHINRMDHEYGAGVRNKGSGRFLKGGAPCT